MTLAEFHAMFEAQKDFQSWWGRLWTTFVKEGESNGIRIGVWNTLKAIMHGGNFLCCRTSVYSSPVSI